MTAWWENLPKLIPGANPQGDRGLTMLDQQTSTLDSLFLEIEKPNTPMHTAGVVIFEEKLPFKQVFETIERRLHLVPRFTQRIVYPPLGLSRPFWVEDPAFDLSYHLRHSALPEPGSDEQLCEFAARLIARPLDRNRPLWEIYVIEGLEGGRGAMVTKTHHAMVDGLATMDLATVLLDFGPEPQRFPPGKPRRVGRLPSRQELVAAAVRSQAKELGDLSGAVRTAAKAPNVVIDAARGVAGAVASTLGTLIKPAPSTGLNTGPGPHRRFAIVRSTLQTFKDIKNVSHATVNDVVLAVCSDALGRLLRSRGENTEARSLRILVPVSVRDVNAKGELGNEVAAIFPDLPIGSMAPLDRLEAVRGQMEGIKESQHAVGAELLVNITRWAPPTLHALAARVGTRARLMNTVISNVPGPQMALYSCGVKMLEPYAVIPLAEGQSLSIGVTSYKGGIFFGLNADRDANPDLHQLARYIEESIGELEKAVAERTSTSITHAETQVAVGGTEP